MCKHCNRQVVIPMPPRGLRPKLDAGQLRDLSLAHVVNLDAIARGEATEEILWQVMGGVLTWSKVSEMLAVGVPEMCTQVELTTRLVERYSRTGRIAFSGPDYVLAKHGLEVMDQLAELVDRPTAIVAAEWSERQVNQMAAQAESRSA